MSVSISGSQITFNDASTQNTSAFTGGLAFRNRIINGAMNVWQRGTSFTPGAGVVTYATDRFAIFTANPSITVSQSTNVPTGQGFKYSAKIQRTAAATATNSVFYNQAIESINSLDLAGQSITVSFWAKAGANYSGSYVGVNVLTGTGTDQGLASVYAGTWTGQSSLGNSNQTLSTTWTKYTVTWTVPSNVTEMALVFTFNPTGTAGADDSFYITGVQLEKGSTATSFDYRPYGTELALCQRYYAAGLYGMGQSQSNTTNISIQLNYPVPMRATPTIGQTGVIQVYDGGANYTQSANSITASFNTATGGFTQMANFTGLTTYRPCFINNNGNSNTLTASAEL